MKFNTGRENYECFSSGGSSVRGTQMRRARLDVYVTTHTHIKI